MSMSTSGSYEKFFRAEGANGPILWDPLTGLPGAGERSVSVIAPRTMTARRGPSRIFIKGREWGCAAQAEEVSRLPSARAGRKSRASGFLERYTADGIVAFLILRTTRSGLSARKAPLSVIHNVVQREGSA